MIYALAILLGIIHGVCGLVSSATFGNIVHLKNGREPNAGAALFPTIPFVPLVFVAATWGLKTIFPADALGLLLTFFVTLTISWAISFRKINRELDRLTVIYEENKKIEPGGPANSPSARD